MKIQQMSDKKSGKEVRLDQHFMISEDIIKIIASKCQQPFVTEIGPGKGALTKKLLKKATVRAIEYDKELFEFLERKFKVDIDSGKLILEQGNVLEKTIKGTIFSNLPYAISEPFLYQIIKNNVTEAYLVTGKRFYDILQRKSKLGFLARTFFIINTVVDIDKSAFSPQPKVSSIFFSMKRKDAENINEEFLQKVLIQTDKKARNAVIEAITHFSFTKNEAKKMITENERLNNTSFFDKKISHLSNEEFILFEQTLTKILKEISLKLK